MNVIKKIPIPISGVAMGCAALGNLLQSYSEGVRLAFGAISGVLIILMLLKIIFFTGMIKEDMKNPVMASISATFTMAVMLLSVYLKPYIGAGPLFVMWIVAIVLHILLIIYFTAVFIAHLKLPAVYASYFIVYVGIAAASITSPAFEKTNIETVCFWFGFISLIVLLVLITVRYIKIPDVPDLAKPLFCIYAAPTSLCLAGYIQSVSSKSPVMAEGMLIASSILYVIALVNMIMCLKLKFFPSYAAFTFPFVITPIAAKQTLNYLTNVGVTFPGLSVIVLAETIIAVAAVVYTLIRYVMFLSVPVKT